MNKEQEVKNNPVETVSQVTEEIKPQDSEETFIADNDNAINLIPIMSKSEVVAEKKKVKFNISAILSIIVFLVVTIAIVAFSTISKLQVDNSMAELAKQEQEVKALSSKVLSNDEILNRIYLYKDISADQYSPKKIFEYFSNIASFDSSIQLDSFTFRSNTYLDFEGKGNSLETVSKFWYLLGEDEQIERVVLDSLSKGAEQVQFSFIITMSEKAFSNNTLEN